MKSISSEEATKYINQIGARLGCDFTYSPSFVEGNDTVCLVTRAVEDGHSYGYSVVYVVWKNDSGVQAREVQNTKSSKDNLYYKDLKIEDGKLKFNLQVSGTYSGRPSQRDVEIDLAS